MNKIIDIDILNGDTVSTDPHQNAVFYRTLENVALSGTMPADAVVNWINGTVNTGPSVTGYPTNIVPAGTPTEHSDSTNQGTGPWNPDTYNYDIYREWLLRQDPIIFQVLGSYNPAYAPLDAQHITVQDIDGQVITPNQTVDSISYTSYMSGGLLKPTVTDNCGVWDSTYVVTTTQGASGCPSYEFLATATTDTWDPSGNDSDLIEDVDVYLDANQFTYFPADTSHPYWITTTEENTGGPATAMNPAGPTVTVTSDLISYMDPDTMTCENVNYIEHLIYTATDDTCGKSIAGTQVITKYKPMSLLCTDFPDPITILEDDPYWDPNFTGFPTYLDTLKTWYPTGYQFWDDIDSTSVPGFWIINRHFNGIEYVCNTTSGDSIHIITRDLEVGMFEPFGQLYDFFTVYPNPSTGILNVKYKSEKSIEGTLQRYDLRGKKLNEVPFEFGPNETGKFHFSDESGVYLLKFITPEFVEQEKLVIVN